MKTKSILLIGLGRFGRHIAENLVAMGHQVMAIDHNEDRVNSISYLPVGDQRFDRRRFKRRVFGYFGRIEF